MRSLFNRTRRNRTLDLVLFALIVLLLLAIVRFLPEPEYMNPNGYARVIDGDSLIVDGMEIRLQGVDAFELAQTCSRAGTEWGCGRNAARRLRAHLGSAPVSCKGNRFDQHGRLLAVCRVKGGEVNRWLVARGWAVSFHEYPEAEREARVAKRGAWSGRFEQPRVWRERQRDAP